MELLFARTDQLLDFVSRHTPLWIYLFVFVAMTVENFFPPFPGDTVVFVCGVYAAGGNASWLWIYLFSIAGTMVSVMALYFLGLTKGRQIFQHSKLRWLGVNQLGKVERWFRRWGEKLLLLSRWLTGMRALMALLAGVGKVNITRMALFSLISTLTWNFFILYLAWRLRQDWQQIDRIFATYNRVIFVGIIVVAIIVLVRVLRRRRKGATG